MRESARRRDDDPVDVEPRRLSRSLAVSWLSVANILLGGFVLIGGQCGVLLITAFGTQGGKLAGLGLPGIGGGTALSLMLVAAIFLWSTAAIASGIGLIHRAGWARVMTLLLGGFAGAVGMLYLVAATLVLIYQGAGLSDGQIYAFLSSFGGAVLFLGHCTWSFLVLLNPKYAREFG